MVLLVAFPAQARHYRILILGNSYAAQTWTGLRDCFAADPVHSATITTRTPGGKQLNQHAEDSTSTNLIASGGPWDVVILQEQSQTPAFAAISSGWWNTFYTTGALPLVQLVRDAGARPMFYQTWARAAGDTDTLQYFNNDPLDMQDALSYSYARASYQLDAEIAPVGEAWEDALQAQPGRTLHSSDRSHPNSTGAFLSGAVLFEAITGKDVRRVSGYRGSLSEAAAADLRSIAHWIFYWEWMTRFPAVTESDPGDNPDGDLRTNQEEWVADTHPGEPADALELGIVMQPDAGRSLSFSSSKRRNYLLEQGQPLADGTIQWDALTAILPGNGETISQIDTNSVSTLLYRISVQREGAPVTFP